MNRHPGQSLRPLLVVILLGAIVTSLVTALRSGFLRVLISWPEDQPAAPLLAAAACVAMILLALYLLLSGRRSSARSSETPTMVGPRSASKPARIGLVAERPPTRFSDVAGAEEAKEELAEIVAQYQGWQHARHAVKPGITGLWQETGRPNGTVMHECTEIDLAYIQQLSLRADAAIMFKTPLALLRKERVV